MSCRPIFHLLTPRRSVCLMALLASTVMAPIIFAEPSRFHTSPACWEEPRVFHHAVDGQGPQRNIEINHGPRPMPATKSLSPNGAYAFHVQKPDTSQPGPWHGVLLIDHEKTDLLEVRIEDLHSLGEPMWINEKLLFLRVWWGRVLATDLIIDVEAEEILYQEAAEYGGIAFQQYQQCRSEEWKDEEICRCEVPRADQRPELERTAGQIGNRLDREHE